MAGKKKAKKLAKKLRKEEKKLARIAQQHIEARVPESGRYLDDETKLVLIQDKIEARMAAYRNGEIDAGGPSCSPDFEYRPSVFTYVAPPTPPEMRSYVCKTTGKTKKIPVGRPFQAKEIYR